MKKEKLVMQTSGKQGTGNALRSNIQNKQTDGTRKIASYPLHMGKC